MDRRLNSDVRITHTQEDLDFVTVVEDLTKHLVGKSYSIVQGKVEEI